MTLLPGDFPTRENCDATNPEEAFLWMFAALPGVKGAPLIMPVSYYRHVSKRLWDLGCRPAEEPTLEWVPPNSSDPNWLTSPGRWVPAGTAPKRSEHDQARDAVSKMTAQQKHELLTVLAGGEPFPDSPTGRVAASLNAHQRTVVLEVLQGEAA
jgi:hypothetical protein